MESIINRIIEIDQKAIVLKEKTTQLIEENEAKLKKQLEEMEKQALEEARKQGKEKYQDYIQEGEEEKQKVIMESERKCSVLEEIFSQVHEGLEKDLFREIFGI